MHLQYLVDAADKFLTEEHAIVEDYVLGKSSFFRDLRAKTVLIDTDWPGKSVPNLFLIVGTDFTDQISWSGFVVLIFRNWYGHP